MLRKWYRFLFNIHYFILTSLIIGVLWLLSLIPIKGDFLNPIEQAFSDFELTDVVFSQLREEQPADTSIVIVNIGEEDAYSRVRIAQQIFNLNRFDPAVIAIDAFFRAAKDSVMDTMLQTAFATTSQLVLVSKLNYYNDSTKGYDTLETSHPELFMPFASSGFANLITEGVNEFRTSRTFSPLERVRDNIELAFPLKVAKLYNPAAAEAFLHRRNPVEHINFRGNHTKFFVLDVDQVLDPNTDLSIIKDKIVLMGYMGRNLSHNTWGEDKFFTPMNKKFAGKSYPDMYGIVVHANIVSMILNRHYIDVMPEGLSTALGVLLLYLNVLVFSLMLKKIPLLYGFVTVIWQLFVTIALLSVVLLLFSQYSYKADVTLALVAVLIAADVCDIYFSLLGTTIRTTKT